MNLREFRQRYPDYDDMSDDELMQALHRKDYSDMPYEQFRERFAGTPPAAKQPDNTTTGGHALEFLKGVPRGLASTVLGGFEGVAGLGEHALGIDRGKGFVTRNLRSAEKAVEEEFAPSPGYEKSFWGDVGTGVGSIAGFAGTGLAAGAAKGIGAVGNIVSKGAVPVIAAGSGAHEARQRLEDYEKRTGKTVDPDRAMFAEILGIGPGLTDVIPYRYLKNILTRASKDEAFRLGPLASIGRMVKTAAVESGQEVAQNILQDYISRLYDPAAEIGKDIGRTIATTGTSSAIFQAGVEAALPFRVRAARRAREEEDRGKIEQARKDIAAEEKPFEFWQEQNKTPDVLALPDYSPKNGLPNPNRDPDAITRYGEGFELAPDHYTRNLTPKSGELPADFAKRLEPGIEPGVYRVVTTDQGYEIVGPRDMPLVKPFATMTEAKALADAVNEVARVREGEAAVQKASMLAAGTRSKNLAEAARASITPTTGFTADEVGEEAVAKVNNTRAQFGLAPVTTFTPDVLADGGVSALKIRELLRSRQPKSEERVTPADIQSVAVERNIDIESDKGKTNFGEFARRVTGMRDIPRMGQEELRMLREAMVKLPTLEVKSALPIVKRQDFTEEQYDQALEAARRSPVATQTIGKDGTIATRPAYVTYKTIRDALGLKRTDKGTELARDILEKMVDRGDIRPVKSLFQRNQFGDAAVDPETGNPIPTRRKGPGVYELYRKYPLGDQSRRDAEGRVPRTVRSEFEMKELPVTGGQGKTEFTVSEKRLSERGELMNEKTVATFPTEAQAQKFIKNKTEVQKTLVRPTRAINVRDATQKEDQISFPDRQEEQGLAITGFISERQKSQFKKELAEAGAVKEAAKRKRAELKREMQRRLSGYGLERIKLNMIEGADKNFDAEYFKRVIKLSLDIDPKDMPGILDHETIHALRDLDLFTDQEWKTLVARAMPTMSDERQTQYRERYKSDGMSDAEIQDAVEEEAVADLFRAWMENPKAAPGQSGGLLNRIKKFFQGLRDALLGAKIRTAEDIFERIRSGEIGKRPEETRAVETAPPAVRARAGLEPGTYNSKTNVGLTDDGRRYSLRKAPVFRSHALDMVNEEKQEKQTGEAWLNRLKSKGVKDEEIEWLGLKEFLMMKSIAGSNSQPRNNVFTKKEIADHIAERDLEVVDFTLSDNSGSNENDPKFKADKEKALKEIIETELNHYRSVMFEFIRANVERLPNGEYRPVLKPLYNNDDIAPGEVHQILVPSGGHFDIEGIGPGSTSHATKEVAWDEATKMKADIIKKNMTRLEEELKTDRDIIDRARREAERSWARRARTRYKDWSEPGGEDYREVLLTLPDVKGKYDHPHWSGFKNVVAHYRAKVREFEGKPYLYIEEIQSDWHQAGRERGYSDVDDVENKKILAADIEALRRQLEDKNTKIKGLNERLRSAGFISSQSPDQNVAEFTALMRATGKMSTIPHPNKVEIRAGFLPDGSLGVINVPRVSVPTITISDAARTELDKNIVWRTIDSDELPSFGFTREEMMEADDLIIELDSGHAHLLELQDELQAETGTPNAPFKEAWHGLALKHALREAAERDLNGIAWTTGIVQAERWDKAFEDVLELAWSPQLGNLYVKTAIRLADNSKIPGDAQLVGYGGDFKTKESLIPAVGKQVAEKLASAENRKSQTGYPANNLHVVSTPDGMKIGDAFYNLTYDSNIPKQAEKIVGKYGAKIERVAIPTGKATVMGAKQKMKEAASNFVKEYAERNIQGRSRGDDVDQAFKTVDLRVALIGIAEEWEAGMLNRGRGLSHDTNPGSPMTLAETAEALTRSGYHTKIDLDVLMDGVAAMKRAADAYIDNQKIPSHLIRFTDKLKDTALNRGFPKYSLKSPITPEQREVIRAKASPTFADKVNLVNADAAEVDRVLSANKWRLYDDKTNTQGDSRYLHYQRGSARMQVRVSTHDFFSPTTAASGKADFDWRTAKPLDDNLEALLKAEKEIRGRKPGDEPPKQEEPKRPVGPNTLTLKKKYSIGYRPRTYGPAVEASLDKLGKPEERSFFRQMWDAIRIPDRTWLAFRAKAFNDLEFLGHQANELKKKGLASDRDLMADVGAMQAALMSRRSGGVLTAALREGIPVYKDGRTTVSSIGVDGRPIQGLIKIMEPIGKNNLWQEFQLYASAIRSQRLAGEKRENLLDPADIKHGLDMARLYPFFPSVHQEYIRWNDGIVEFLKQTGVINEAMAINWRKDRDYVPFYREFDGEQRGYGIFRSLTGQKPPPKLKGGHEKLNVFTENLVQNARAAISAGMKNIAARRAIRDAVLLNSAAKVKDPVRGGVTIRVNGQDEHYRLNDPLLYNALTGLDSPEPVFSKLFTAPAQILRSLVTHDPGFMAANLVRDTLSAWLTAARGPLPVMSTIGGLTKALQNSPSSDALRRAGVYGGFDFAGDIEVSGRRLQSEYARAWYQKIWDTLEKGTSASDAATRIAVYEDVLRKTGNPAQAEFEALETLNFSRKGSSRAIKLLAATVPFFNARIQGIDVLMRAGTQWGASGRPDKNKITRTFWTRALFMTLMTLAYYSAVSDDDQWKNAQPEERDNYWLLPVFGKDQPWLRVPIPFEVGVLFKVLPERLAAQMAGKDNWRDLEQSAKRQALSTLAINPIPQTVKPILEAVTNYSFFRGREVEPKSLADLMPGERYTSGTSEVSKVLGKVFDMSPVAIDNVIRGYVGSIGSAVLWAADEAIRFSTDAPVRPTMKLEDYPLMRRFLQQQIPMGNTDALYDLRDKARELAMTVASLSKTGRTEDAMKLIQENKQLFAVNQATESIARQLSQLRQYRKMLENNRSISGDEKRAAVDNIKMMEQKLAGYGRELRNRVYN